MKVVVDPDQRELVRLETRPLVHHVEAEIEALGHVDAIILFEVLVAVKFCPGQIFLYHGFGL